MLAKHTHHVSGHQVTVLVTRHMPTHTCTAAAADQAPHVGQGAPSKSRWISRTCRSVSFGLQVPNQHKYTQSNHSRCMPAPPVSDKKLRCSYRLQQLFPEGRPLRVSQCTAILHVNLPCTHALCAKSISPLLPQDWQLVRTHTV
jgi:hypothetical protein